MARTRPHLLECQNASCTAHLTVTQTGIAVDAPKWKWKWSWRSASCHDVSGEVVVYFKKLSLIRCFDSQLSSHKAYHKHVVKEATREKETVPWYPQSPLGACGTESQRCGGPHRKDSPMQHLRRVKGVDDPFLFPGGHDTNVSLNKPNARYITSMVPGEARHTHNITIHPPIAIHENWPCFLSTACGCGYLGDQH